MNNRFSDFEENFKSLEVKEKRLFIENFLKICDPAELFYLDSELDKYKRDFICLLPIEIVELIFRYLDWESLLLCCQVKFYYI